MEKRNRQTEVGIVGIFVSVRSADLSFVVSAAASLFICVEMMTVGRGDLIVPAACLAEETGVRGWCARAFGCDVSDTELNEDSSDE